MTPIRWVVEIDYRTNNGIITVVHDIEELEELHDIVERGPDWNAIEYPIRITLNPEVGEPVTIEQSEVQ